ncbi:MAG TPA: zinc ribbon domain-containing protein [Gemmatimonadaceae bacterium]|jgi:hypothetical protein|nr:zinc ribbon domain-containing protein [Gemmatimonadaceae bacterium]
MIALVIGTVLAVGALAFVLYPIFFGAHRAKQAPSGAADQAAIDEEIEAAVRAYRAGEKKHDRCAVCGTPVVRDAHFCANCGSRLPA